MLCDKYEEALIEAAASGAALPNALREHVESCAHCGVKLAGERTLFAALDAGLHKAANAKVRSGFLPGVKANLATETVPSRSPIPGWALVCATGALAFAVAAAFISLPRGAHDKARTEAITASSKVPPGAEMEVLSLAPEHKTRYAARAYKAPERQNVSAAASHETEVLVQPEEEEYLKRFYSTVRNPVRNASTVVDDEHEIVPKPLVIKQIAVNELKIEDLEESGLALTNTK